MKADKYLTYRGTVNGNEMTLLDLKARQLALATIRIEALLRQAWAEAQQPIATQPASQPVTLPSTRDTAGEPEAATRAVSLPASGPATQPTTTPAG